jgi:hypothetical protein
VAYSDTSDSESEFSSDDFEATEKATTSPLPMVAELPSIRKTLQMFELRAEKQLGQHFIVDHLITGKASF